MSDTLHAFAARRRQAAETLADLAGVTDAAGAGTARFVEPLRAGATRLREGRFTVLLVGCFSSGKSSVLNALLGQPVLPVKVNPCTAILTELRAGEAPSVEVLRRDGTAEHLEPAAFLARYQLGAGDPGERLDAFADVERAIVRWPLPLLADGVALVDTPGLDDDPSRTERTLRGLPDADAVIFVLNATRFLTELERDTLRRDVLPLGLTNLFFPVAMIDLIDALSDRPDEDRAEVRRRATEALGPLCTHDGIDRLDERFFPIDARGALRARWDGAPRSPVDAAALARSGFPAFEGALERFLVHERGRAQLLRGLHLAERAFDGVQRQAALDRATARTSVEELRARHEALAPDLDRLGRIAARVADTVDAFVAREAERTWQSLRAALADAEADLPRAVDTFDLSTIAGLDLLTPAGRARAERVVAERVEAWLEERLAAWRADLAHDLERALADLRTALAAEAHDFRAVTEGIVSGFAGGAVRAALPGLHGDEPDPLERWFSVALGAVLLSPATMAAGWAQGYEGALKGAAGRVAVRVAVLALGALLGPVGWAGIALYVVSDAALLVLTGGAQLRRLRRQVADGLQGRLVAQADAARDAVTARARESLAPIRDAIVGAAQAEADDLARALDALLAAREAAVATAAERARQWEATEAGLSDGIGRLRALIGPDPSLTPKRTVTFAAGAIPDALRRAHDLKAGTWGVLEVTAGSLVFVDADGARTPLGAGDRHPIPPVRPHHVEPSEDAAITLHFFDGPPHRSWWAPGRSAT
jgi:tellurite resistance-related uncharacterized protein